MPWYDFRCTECGSVFEKKRSFAQAGEVATCPACYSRATQKLVTASHLISQQPAARSVPVPMTRKGGGGCGCGSCYCND